IPVGLTVYNSNAESFKRKGAPIDWVPVQPVVARPQGIGIARAAPHREAAQAFVDFVLSPEGQQLYESMGRVPVSSKVRTHMNQFEYTLVGVAVAALAAAWQPPDWLEHSGAWISIAVLALLGGANLLAVLRTPVGQPVALVGVRSRWLPARLAQTSHPAVIAAVGAAFAISFDTMSNA